MKTRLKFTDTEYGTYIGDKDSPEPLSQKHAETVARFERDNPNHEWVQLHNRMRGYLSPLMNKTPNVKFVENPGDVPLLRNTTTGHEVASSDGTFDLWKYGQMVKHSRTLREAIEWLK